jgi:hypothetical protein
MQWASAASCLAAVHANGASGGLYLDRDIILVDYDSMNSTPGNLILVAKKQVSDNSTVPLVYPAIIIAKEKRNTILRRVMSYQLSHFNDIKKDVLIVGPRAFTNVLTASDNVGWGGVHQDSEYQNPLSYMFQNPMTMRPVAIHVQEFNRVDYSKGKRIS